MPHRMYGYLRHYRYSNSRSRRHINTPGVFAGRNEVQPITLSILNKYVIRGLIVLTSMYQVHMALVWHRASVWHKG